MADVHIPHGNVMYKVNSGAIRFQVKTVGHKPEIKLFDETLLYKILLGRETKVIRYVDEEEAMINFETFNLTEFTVFKQLCLTWYGNKIKLFLEEDDNPDPLIDFVKPITKQISFIKFKPVCQENFMNTPFPVAWIVETSPVILEKVPKKKFLESLEWVKVTNGLLPPNAMIGGFDQELTYIARAYHNRALCPGKYVPSKRMAFVPWGHEEHSKTDFEILCGFNAKWVKTVSNEIPFNAYVGGHSEFFPEPLYIGRAMIDGNLVTGKVHVLYKTCYLPYDGREVEVSSYERLVIPELEIPQIVKGKRGRTTSDDSENGNSEEHYL